MGQHPYIYNPPHKHRHLKPNLHLQSPSSTCNYNTATTTAVRRKTQQKTHQKMGLTTDAQSHHKTHKFFLICNCILLGAASSCIFLTLSLRLIPSVAGGLLVLLHIITIAGAISGCNAVNAGSNKWYAAHMVAAVLTAIFQGSVSVLIFTTTANFLSALKSYVREDDAAVILKMAGGLCVLMFCLEWLVLTLAFFLRYYAFVDGGRTAGKVAATEDEKAWTPPFRV